MKWSLDGLYQRLRRRDRHADDDGSWLRQVRGVLHVGANTGQEREKYQRHGLQVVWIEPLPEVFAQLQTNIAGMPKQRAVQALVVDRDGVEVDFHVANNEGLSSSMLALGQHRDIWPEVHFERTLRLKTTTLDALARDGALGSVREYDGLVMDTQGSELLVLRGAESVLERIQFVKTEAADFESYVGCCRLKDIDAFLRARGFREFSRHRFAEREGGGAYYDVVYRRGWWF